MEEKWSYLEEKKLKVTNTSSFLSPIVANCPRYLTSKTNYGCQTLAAQVIAAC